MNDVVNLHSKYVIMLFFWETAYYSIVALRSSFRPTYDRNSLFQLKRGKRNKLFNFLIKNNRIWSTFVALDWIVVNLTLEGVFFVALFWHMTPFFVCKHVLCKKFVKLSLNEIKTWWLALVLCMFNRLKTLNRNVF